MQQGKVVRTQSHKLRVRTVSLAQDRTWGCNSPRRHHTTLFCLISYSYCPSTFFPSAPVCLFFPFAPPEVSVLLVPCREKAAQICVWLSFKTLRWANLSVRFQGGCIGSSMLPLAVGAQNLHLFHMIAKPQQPALARKTPLNMRGRVLRVLIVMF